MATTKDKVYAGGDAVTGAATVILAMGAGKTAAAVVGLGRIQGDSLFLPVHQILADSVSPVHSAPYRRIGKMLIEQMVLTFIIYKSVGIVYPV